LARKGDLAAAVIGISTDVPHEGCERLIYVKFGRSGLSSRTGWQLCGHRHRCRVTRALQGFSSRRFHWRLQTDRETVLATIPQETCNYARTARLIATRKHLAVGADDT
jgi:hypothetical protein